MHSIVILFLISLSVADCDNNQYLNDRGDCLECDGVYPGCNSCDSTKCTSCKPGYKQISLENAAVSCEYLDGFTSEDKTSCGSGFIQNSNSNSCEYCLNCAADSCDSQNKCTKCLPDYFLKDGYCYSCYKCKSEKCSSTTGCTECENGYYSKDGFCNSCGACKSDKCGSSGCTECEDGYYLKDGYCTRCENCEGECSNSEGCAVCEFHYYEDEGKCLRCSLSCEEGCDKTGCIDSNSASLSFISLAMIIVFISFF
ncbi:hypothetical protein, conserved [Entamoeba dispar SAW760]|uniref:Uncharacterized protein n=1 Tax=Entamoeba dispar (strain ATCC PRA-260 / SAW760) TaxID=370354 RepID=B0EJ98_ENTDS|nr:uncharacterized protein EDI_002700 [Entamoeba dispar SAW760]EDR25406.1 hypothetical protein, conserved [Entamoeba dispar SAW760]|eukprot:EDR25406.1 hypothetical protein, conserved [Entamoeba dispar SAW760]